MNSYFSPHSLRRFETLPLKARALLMAGIAGGYGLLFLILQTSPDELARTYPGRCLTLKLFCYRLKPYRFPLPISLNTAFAA